MTSQLLFHRAFVNPQPRPPIWLMRQAGRYLPEYRETRARAGDFVALCLNPQLASEVTLQPIRRFGFDAAIIFSDILMVPFALSQELWFQEGEGPRLGPADWHDFDAEKLKPVYEAITLTRSQLPKETALIGFAGAPWTLLMYALQGRGGNEFHEARLQVYANPQEAAKRIAILAQAVTAHLINQIDAGCDTVQIFDSWAGLCPMSLQDDYIIKPTQTIIQNLRAHNPDLKIIAFAKGLQRPDHYAHVTNPDAIGIDQFTDLSQLKTLNTIQGNLDPLALIAGGDVLKRAVESVLEQTRDKKHIFNLGHGIDKSTPIAHVETLIRQVRT